MSRPRTDVKALVADERRDLADLAETLTADEWSRPSLCEGWTVRDVLAHVTSYEHLGWRGGLRRMAGARFDAGRANEIGLREARHRSHADLVDALRTHARPRGITAGFGGRIGLTDAVIHHQDIRRAIGRPRTVPADRLATALSFSLWALPLPSRTRTRGLRLVADDLDWNHGSGPEVTGPGEALLLGIAGRDQVLDELAGPGLARFAAG